MIIALLALAPLAAAAAPAQDTPERLAELRARIQAVQAALEQDRARRGAVQTELEQVEQRLAGLTAALSGIEQRIRQQNAQLAATRAERAAAEIALGQQRLALGRQVRAAYVIGQRGKTKLLLNQDRTQRLSRVMTYYDYLNRARAARIEGILQQSRTLEEIEARVQQETHALEATRAEQQGTLTALEAARGERGTLLQSLGQRIAGAEGELKQLRASERELARLMEQITSALADIPANLGAKPLAQLKGRLPWPLKGRLLARFGDFKAEGQLRWNGLWIAGREGDPVRAVARGRVAYVGWMHRYGLITVLEHEGGFYSLYGHVQGVAVNVGDWVNPGDVIARAGNTGGHQKSGLYFELRQGTEPVNPRSWLRRQ